MKNILRDQRIKDFLFMISSNMVSLVAGLVAALVIPKFLGIEDYAYYRIFSFYAGYVVIFSLGFNDGVYVRYGNVDYENLPKEKFRMYIRSFLRFQILIACILVIVSYFLINDFYRQYIVLFVALNSVIVNISGLLSFILQFTKKFKFYSINLILSKILFICSTLLCLILGYINYKYLVVLQTLINLIVLISYIYKMRDLIFGYKEPFLKNIKDIVMNVSIGFFIMIGNLTEIVILGLDRMVMDNFFSLEDFAYYSFGVSLLTVVYLLLQSMAMVVYPYLSRSKVDNFGLLYAKVRISLLVVLGCSLSSFFFAKYFVEQFLPNYLGALPYMLLLMPTVLMRGQMKILSENLYKILRLQKDYTINNLIALIMGCIVNVIALVVFRNPYATAVSSVITFYLWQVFTDFYYAKRFKMRLIKVHLVQCLVIALFWIIGAHFNWYMGLIVFLFSFMATIFVFFFKEFKEILAMRLNFFNN